MKKQSGFTLIELVVVMVILGILAAVAMPKFIDMSAQAREAKLKGAFGAVRSAMTLTHAQSLAKGSNDITVEGTNYTLVFGYPSGTDIAALAGVNTGGDYDLGTATAASATIAVPGVTTAASCSITYTAATSATAPATATLPATIDCK